MGRGMAASTTLSRTSKTWVRRAHRHSKPYLGRPMLWVDPN